MHRNIQHADAAWTVGMLVTMLALVALVALAIAWVVRVTGHDQVSAPTHDTTRAAEQVLAERLARGEIDVDEYRSRLAALARSR